MYQVVTSVELSTLENRVAILMTKGYIPAGGISQTRTQAIGSHPYNYAQAMWKPPTPAMKL